MMVYYLKMLRQKGVATLALVNKMVDDLSALNESGAMSLPS